MLFRLYQRGLDRHAAPQSSKKDGELAMNPTPPRHSSDPNAPRKTSLVERLCDGDHPVEVGLRPEKTVKLFKKTIDRNYVHN